MVMLKSLSSLESTEGGAQNWKKPEGSSLLGDLTVPGLILLETRYGYGNFETLTCQETAGEPITRSSRDRYVGT